MERTALLHTDYLDILFQNRNKAYGGYELRKHYPDRIRKALFTVVFFVSGLGGYQLYTTLHKHQTSAVFPKETVIHLQNIPVDNLYVPPPPPPPKAVAAPKVAATVANPPITIAPDKTVIDNPPKTSDDLKGKQIGAHDNPGNGGDSPDLGGKTGAGTGTGEMPAGNVGDLPASSEPVRFVEQMPQFAGSMEDYLHNNLRYPEMAREAGVQGRVVVEFVVNEVGEIGAIKVRRGIGGGCDDEAVRVIKNMPRWRPGKQNGHPVNVLMTLPITFTLD
ncbi:energy transducer TonB [Taibaiella soli]|uniref:Energy transducer TonB n=1 Tax=Taibaiella soli TaxID=1649169 RepID=A0A2W2B554_9BACT|nr:energy transducer TonB [Taibaiella soli]PZF71359.1 energy transducer TonB [Taibaiella soli]